MKKRAVLSVSGGMDSTTLMIHMLNKGYNLRVLSFFYNQKHDIELSRLKNNILYLKNKGFFIDHHTVDLSSVMSLYDSALIRGGVDIPEGHYSSENMKPTVVPNRNAIFSSIVYGMALSDVSRFNTHVDIALGVHSGDREIYPDCRPEFFDSIERVFKMGNWKSENVSYYLPYVGVTKYEILLDGKTCCDNLNLDFNTLYSNTITCYQPNSTGRSCGKCGSCVERIEAFSKMGIQDPIEYVNNWDVTQKHTTKILGEL